MAIIQNHGNGGLMQAFFYPAEAIMSRLNITRKFVLLGLMALFAMAVVAYSLFLHLDRDISFLQREAKGLELIRPFQQTVQLLQEHRGISAGLLGGDTTMLDIHASTGEEVSQALEKMREGALSVAGPTDELRLIQEDWEHLRKTGLNWPASENRAAHTRLIQRIRLLELAVADKYLLVTDSDIDAYYLVRTILEELPQAIEQLGQLRASGTVVLAEKRLSAAQQAEMGLLLTGFDNSLEKIKANLGMAYRHNPALRAPISAALENISDAAMHISNIVTTDVFTRRFATPSSDFFWIATSAIDSGYAQIRETMLPVAENLVRERIEQAELTLRTTLSAALVLFLGVAYFSIGVIRSVVANIGILLRATRFMADGNLDERVKIDASDELGKMGKGLDDVICGFRLLLEASRNNEKRLQELSLHLEERVKERTAELELAQRDSSSLLNRYKTLMATSMDGIHLMDVQGNLIEANEAFLKMLCYTKEEAAGMNVTEWDAQWTREEIRNKFIELAGRSALFETLHRRKDGTVIEVEIIASGVELEGQYFVIASSRDITLRKQAEATLKRHKIMIDTAIDGFWLADIKGNLQEANTAYAKMSGYSVEELVKMHISDLEACEKTLEEVQAHVAKIIAQGYDRFETRHRRKDGQEIDIEVSTTFLPESQQLVVFCRDITERKKTEQEIRSLAFYDTLTKLPNRRLFLDRFDAALAASARYDNFGAVLFVDLDHFKRLNDTLGHECGDLLLIEVASRIKSCVREVDTPARLGGDEFVVLLEDISNNQEGAARNTALIAEKIRETLARPYQLREHEYRCSPSIGIRLYRGNEEPVEELLRQADMAMYQAKNAGRNVVRFFDPAGAG